MLVRTKKGLKVETNPLDCEDIRDRIVALTRLIKAADKTQVSDIDIYWTMNMIEEHLPPDEMLLEKDHDVGKL